MKKWETVFNSYLQIGTFLKLSKKVGRTCFFFLIALYINLSRNESPIKIVMVLDFTQTLYFLGSFWVSELFLFF